MSFVFDFLNRTDKQFFRLDEVAKGLGRHPNTIRNWDDDGLLPAMRTPGKHRTWSRTVLIQFGASMNGGR